MAAPKKKRPLKLDPNAGINRSLMAADAPSSHAARQAQQDIYDRNTSESLTGGMGYRPFGVDPMVAKRNQLQTQVDKEKFDRGQAIRAGQSGFAQHLGTPGNKPATPTQKKPPAVPPPAKIDPVTGRTMSRGNPVPTAYSGSPSDRAGLFGSSALGTARAAFKPANAGAKAGPKLQDLMRGQTPASPPRPSVRDPYSGQAMQKGQPVPNAFDNSFNRRVGLGLRTAGTAVGMAMKPPSLGAKGRATPAPQPTPVSPAQNPARIGRAAAMPPSRLAPGPNTDTLDSVSRRMPNSPGYEDFPSSLAPGKKPKKNGY
jgi:hypothetical protein